MNSRARPLVIIPTYNERDNLDQLIPAVLDGDERRHVLIVDDGSPDGTAAAVLQLQKAGNGGRLFLESRPEKLGLGSAYTHGFRWGCEREYDLMIQMDADWSHHPAYLDTMQMAAEGVDFVIGSRYRPGGGITNWGGGRRLLSKFGNTYARLALGTDFTDFTGGFNAWSADVLRKIGLESIHSDGYCFQIELKYRAHRLGFRHAEFPIIFDERRAGKSKMSASIAFEAFWRVWQLRLEI